MRKVFCDGCEKELMDIFTGTFLKNYNNVYLETTCDDGTEILWCKKCTDVARKAVIQKGKDNA